MALQSTTALATVTLQASSSEVTFSGIPSIYRDLVLVINNMTATANNDVYVRVNGDTNANYSYVQMEGDGTSTYSGASSSTSNGLRFAFGNATLSNGEMWILDYSATDKHKTALARVSNSGYTVKALADRWASLSVVSSLNIRHMAGNFNSGTTVSLYGRIA